MVNNKNQTASANSRLSALPPRAVAMAEQAAHFLEQSDAQRALIALDAALCEAPSHPELLRLRGFSLLLQGQIEQALESYRLAAASWPKDALIACQLGAVLARTGDLAAAESAFRQATVLDVQLVDAWYNLGHALDARADTVGACAAFERVLEINPGHLPARIQRAEMLKMLGSLDQAERELREVLRRDRDCVSAWVGLSNLKTFRPSVDDLDHLLQLQASATVAENRRVDLAFACATLLEEGGRYADAFRLFGAANSAKRRSVRWNAASVSHLVDDILTRFASLPDDAVHETRGTNVIFLVGMPRSGSTLAEQILSAHPDVQGGGERNEIALVLQHESRRRGRAFPYWVAEATGADWDRLGQDYLQRCSTWRDSRPNFTNKTLTNWQTLGAIRRMLPGARVVHCQRDAVETLWSCYKHHFGEAQLFTYDMHELTAFWRDCERSMRSWSLQRPGWIHAHVHEELLADPERRIRALLQYCDLRFDPACMTFHENRRDVRTSSASQVRQPLKSTAPLALHYGKFFDSLRRSMDSQAKSNNPTH